MQQYKMNNKYPNLSLPMRLTVLMRSYGEEWGFYANWWRVEKQDVPNVFYRIRGRNIQLINLFRNRGQLIPFVLVRDMDQKKLAAFHVSSSPKLLAGELDHVVTMYALAFIAKHQRALLSYSNGSIDSADFFDMIDPGWEVNRHASGVKRLLTELKPLSGISFEAINADTSVC